MDHEPFLDLGSCIGSGTKIGHMKLPPIVANIPNDTELAIRPFNPIIFRRDIS